MKYNSGYLAGLLDSDGSIYLNIKSQQVFITITQKNRELLDIIATVYGGVIYSSNADNNAFKGVISKKMDVLYIIDNYFHTYNCISAKNKQLSWVKEFYWLSSIGATKAQLDSSLGKSMVKFKMKWDKYYDGESN